LKNKDIVMFQEKIGADIVSPLDIVTPPGDSRKVAEQKLTKTLARVREASGLLTRSTLAAVQQGGRFLDLRRRSVEGLMEIGAEYVAIGSLVPFFTRNHDLRFVGAVLREARQVTGPDIPIHIYGAGDPVELPFMVALGADVFDSSSYAHFAQDGWYMTPFGAIRDPAPLITGQFHCKCHICGDATDIRKVFDDKRSLAAHNLWTITRTIRRAREALANNSLGPLLESILERHASWFPESELPISWGALHA
jgi:7-cyano-7-deazaguanine tRNA-ribosyltransferase